MPFYRMTRQAEFLHVQTFIVESRDRENAAYVDSVDVERQKLLSSESSNQSGWRTEDEQVQEIGEDEAERLAGSGRPAPHGQEAWLAVERCAAEAEAFLGRGADGLVREIAAALRALKPYPGAGAEHTNWDGGDALGPG